MNTTSEERVSLLQPGEQVLVRKGDDYMVRGRFLGLEQHLNGAAIRVLPEDGIERKVPLPASVTTDAR